VDGCAHATAGSASLRALSTSGRARGWLARYRARLASEPVAAAERAHTRMNPVNPKFVLRNPSGRAAIRQARGDDGPRDFSEWTVYSAASAPV